MSDTLVAAREAVERHAWEEARESFLTADREGSLSPNDLQLLADAAWWSGYPDEAVEALERAYAGFVEAGDKNAAGIVAFWLTYFAMRRGAGAVGAGWMSKAEDLLGSEPESAAHAWLHFLRMVGALMVRGDFQEAIPHGERAVEVATTYGVPSVRALARSFQGYALIFQGEWRKGMALMDEVTAAAVSGELDPHTACNVYCNTIACCATMADYRRAGEWTTEAERWMQRQSLGGYPGVCRVHRAELKKLHGSYPEAEQEARVACDELEHFHLLDAAGFATTRSARSGSGWVTWTRPRRRSCVPTSTGGTPSRAWRCSSWPVATWPAPSKRYLLRSQMGTTRAPTGWGEPGSFRPG